MRWATVSFVLQKRKKKKASRRLKLCRNVTAAGFAAEPRLSSHGFCEVLEQAALSPAHCGGLSPGPFPLCRLTDSVAAACLWKPMAQQLCDRDYTSSAHWLLAVLTVPPPLPFIRRAVFSASTWTWTLINCAAARALIVINTGAVRPANYCRKGESSTSLCTWILQPIKH